MKSFSSLSTERCRRCETLPDQAGKTGILCLSHGADLLQGYLFAKPGPDPPIPQIPGGNSPS